MTRDLEAVKSAKEKLSLQLAEISGNALTQSQSQSERNDNLTKMVSALESEVARRKGQAAEAEGKLAKVEKEFQSYKVRAQNVLRQKETSAGGDSNQSHKSQEVMHFLSYFWTRADGSSLVWNLGEVVLAHFSNFFLSALVH